MLTEGYVVSANAQQMADLSIPMTTLLSILSSEIRYIIRAEI